MTAILQCSECGREELSGNILGPCERQACSPDNWAPIPEVSSDPDRITSIWPVATSPGIALQTTHATGPASQMALTPKQAMAFAHQLLRLIGETL